MDGFAELSIGGHVARPGDPDWDDSRQAWNLAADQQPCAVAFVESAGDVAKVIRFAGAHDLNVTGQGTGHGAVALGPLHDTIVIKTERMRRVDVDAQARTARLEAGVLALELGGAAQSCGLCSLPGSAPDVGVVGYTLGGGLSWLGRRYGLACNSVRAIELVTADGESRRVDADHDADLFWALRGGGGGYAIVTALHLALLPISELYAGALSDEAIDAFVGAAGPEAGSPLLLAELRQAGGALARAPDDAGALGKLDAAFVMLGVGLPMTPELGEAIDRHLDHLHDSMKPWASDGGYLNFAERPCDIDAILPSETCARLRGIKRRWDPGEMIRANHTISPSPL
jgi:FAD/FMN-containing dehydrogenase